MNLKEKLVHGDEIMATDLMIFIKKWLIEHILIEDKKYATFCEDNNIKFEG
jgi:hemerythrin